MDKLVCSSLSELLSFEMSDTATKPVQILFFDIFLYKKLWYADDLLLNLI